MFKKVGMGSGGSSQKKLVTEAPPPHIHESQYVGDDFQIDEANPPAIIPTPGYKVELGSAFPKDEIQSKLEYVEQYSPYYRDNFYDIEHVNFVGGEEANPIVISIQADTKLPEFKVIVRTAKADHAFNLPPCSKGKMIARATDIMPSLGGFKFKEVKDIAIKKDLLHLEDRLLIRQYKFGVIYCKESQKNDDDMFSNEHGSPEFEDFLDLLGDRIKLQGWQGFDGELDTKTNTTGTHSVFTTVEGWDVMFHVSTLLPYSPVNPQQIERKRHIGNDICVIIFQDGTSTPFDPKTIASKYNHVYAIVQLEKKKTEKHKAKYRIAFVSKQAVKPFGPLIPSTPTFKHNSEMREFLLHKLVNGERAAYAAPSFGVTRTRRDWLKGILSTYK